MWQYCIDDPKDNIREHYRFKYKIKITAKTLASGNTKNAKIAVPLKYLSNFWRTLEITLIKYEINLILNCSADCFVFPATGETKFAKTDTKLCVPVETLSTQDNPELLEQLRSAFERPIDWNKYHPKTATKDKINI